MDASDGAGEPLKEPEDGEKPVSDVRKIQEINVYLKCIC